MLVRITGAFIAMLCGYGCYWAARWALADYTIRTSVEYGLHLAPGNPDYYVLLAQVKPALALSALQHAADLNPSNSSVWMEVATAAERQHEFGIAESALQRAVQLDKTFAPRWLLAEYYSRRHDQRHFWPAVQAALAASYDDVAPLFDMCWNLAPDPSVIRDRALPERADVWRQYFDFLLANGRLDAANETAPHILLHAGPDSVRSLLLYCDRLLEQDEVARAVETWNLLAVKHLLDYPILAPVQGVSLTNGSFAKVFLSRAFDWRVSAPEEVMYRQDDSPPGLRFDFSGNQPEHCELLSQFVPLEAAREYRLVVTYEPEELEGDPGIAWRAVNMNNGADLLRADGRLTGGHGEKTEPYRFQTPVGVHLIKLVLAYDRPIGAMRIKGSMVLRRVSLGFNR